ncbi:MAG TPA: site-specific integrase [Terriglobia bacterium]|nr:site-specific integrase [Terriglobia bacterium]
MLIGTVEKLSTKADAQRAVEHRRMEINAHNPQQQFHAVTVGGLIDRFVKEELPKERRFQTQSEYRTYFECYIRPQWGKTLVDEVDPLPVMDWLQSLRGKKTKKPLAPKTKAHIRNALYLLFQWAWRWKLVDHNPIQLVRQSTRRLRIPRVLTPEQFRALLDKLNEPYRTMVLVAGCTGLRVCEIVGLKWGDINWQNLAIDVRRSVVAGREGATKTEASERPVPLDPDLATALLTWRGKASRTAESDYVFAGETGKARWQAMILKDYVRPAAVKAEIGKVGWHTFRHTYRASLKRCSTPLEVQKELMRHANVRTTADIYGLDSDLTPAHREANSGVVKMLLGG